MNIEYGYRSHKQTNNEPTDVEITNEHVASSLPFPSLLISSISLAGINEGITYDKSSENDPSIRPSDRSGGKERS